MINLHDTSSGSGQRARQWPWMPGALLALLAGVALTSGGCSLPGIAGGPAHSGGASTPGAMQPSEKQTEGEGYSVDFAKCMRANGVPSFPDPGGQGPFAPGVDPSSSTYKAALNGPCRSLAPPAWVSSGPSIPGGGS